MVIEVDFGQLADCLIILVNLLFCLGNCPLASVQVKLFTFSLLIHITTDIELIFDV